MTPTPISLPVISPLRRAAWRWGVALFALSAALCWVPLFNLLAFEFAFAVGIVATFAAGGLGVRAARTTPDAPWRAWRRAGLYATALLLPPLLPISLNALRVRNCDYFSGLLLYGLLPGLTVWVASAWGVAAGRTLRRARLAFSLLVLATLLRSLARFWFDPPVDAFHPVFGYYPGAIYDEFIPVGLRLIASRAEDLLAAVALLALTTLPRRRLVPAVAICAALGAHALSQTLDIHRDADHIKAALGGLTTTAHFDVVHPAHWPADAVLDLATDLEFAHHELAAFFGVEPTRTTAYLYPDRATKKRLMGAGRTRVAKPWQRSLHVHGAHVGQTVLIHELAHVFSASIANGPHHLSLYRGLVPHMPLIEGLAEAATWPTDRLDLHDWSAAMREVGVAPPLTDVLAPTGFYLRNARTAYTLCGSFMRFYGEAYGAEAMHAAYRDGAFPPAAFATLLPQWQRMLDQRALDPRALAHARARFDQPAIFGKVCAHEIAALRVRADRQIRRGDRAAALSTQLEILGHIPRDVRARLARLRLLHALERDAEAATLAAEITEDASAGAVARRVAAEWQADLAVLAGRPEAARPQYQAAFEQAFVRAHRRRLAVKLAALDHPAGPSVLELLLTPALDQAAIDARYAAVARTGPSWGVARYLLARHNTAKAPAEARAHLDAALRLGLPTPALRLEAQRMLARLAFNEGAYPAARSAYQTLAARTDLALTGAERSGLSRWARRAQFFASRRATVDKTGPRFEYSAPRARELRE